MKHLKKFALALIAVVAMGGFTVGSASAATGGGSADISLDGFTDCGILFKWNSSTGAISDITHTTCTWLAGAAPVDFGDSTLRAEFSGLDNTVSITGIVDVSISHNSFTCRYTTATLGALGGDYLDYSGARHFFTNPQDVAKLSGIFICPSPLANVEFRNGSIEL